MAQRAPGHRLIKDHWIPPVSKPLRLKAQTTTISLIVHLFVTVLHHFVVVCDILWSILSLFVFNLCLCGAFVFFFFFFW